MKNVYVPNKQILKQKNLNFVHFFTTSCNILNNIELGLPTM